MKTTAFSSLLVLLLLIAARDAFAQPAETTAPMPPQLHNFTPLPEADAALSEKLAAIVQEVGLDGMTPAADNPDGEDEYATICFVDLSSGQPVVAAWKGDNFVYPASTYKMYVLGEVIRRVVEGDMTLDDPITVDANNVREEQPLTAGKVVPLSEILRLLIQDSSNTAANVAIDLVDRQSVTALLRAMGMEGSDVTRKFLPRDREDPQYAKAPGTTTCANHLATFLWAVEQGAIGGGRGRGLIKGYLATCMTNYDRYRAGTPDSATLYAKTGEWNIFTAEAALVEDGPVKYILCAIVPQGRKTAAPKMAKLATAVHELAKERAAAAQ